MKRTTEVKKKSASSIVKLTSKKKKAVRKSGMEPLAMLKSDDILSDETHLEDRISAIRNGLPAEVLNILIKAMGIDQDLVYKVLHISKRTVQRRKLSSERLTSISSDIAVQLSKLYTYGTLVFGNDREEFIAWMNRKNIPLGGKKPLDILDTSEGRAAIHHVLNHIYYSIPY